MTIYWRCRICREISLKVFSHSHTTILSMDFFLLVFGLEIGGVLAAFYNCRTLFFKIMLMMIEAYIDTALLFEWGTGNTLTIYINTNTIYIYRQSYKHITDGLVQEQLSCTKRISQITLKESI